MNNEWFNGKLPGPPGAYEISRSVRFNSADSAHLSRTPASAGNRKTWTWAGWVKRSGSWSRLFAAGSSLFSNPVFTAIGFETDKIVINEYNFPSAGWGRDSVAVFRDYSAWYHIVVAVDTTQATDTNRVKLYVNGVEQSTVTRGGYSAFPVQNADTYINTTTQHQLSASNGTNSSNFYLADIHFIDGQALDPTSFGEFDTNGVWQPIAYAGSYGTNGFHLPFSDNSTAAALGTDTSGNNNTWTVNNISVAAGAGNDSLVDSPTNYGTDTGAGGEVRGNYCTWGATYAGAGGLSNGNLDFLALPLNAYGSISITSGKWYWEILNSGTGLSYVGIIDSTITSATDNTWSTQARSYQSSGNKYDGSSTSYGASYAAGDVIGFALDLDANTLTFYKNGVSQGVAFSSGLIGKEWKPHVYGGSGAGCSANFGQRPFAYTAPSGFKALCTTNLPEPTIADGSTAMDVVTYTGDGSTDRAITGLSFSPDFLWIKRRNTSLDHLVWDAVRGVTKELYTNQPYAEGTATNKLTSLDPNGFTVKNNSATNALNDTYVAWTWDAGSSTVTNTQGSITSQVRANPSAGFSIVTWTAPTTYPYTLGHGLSAKPELIIAKRRSISSDWYVYHRSLGSTKVLFLNRTDAQLTASAPWNDTEPTSSVFTAGSSFDNSETVVAYCFAPVAGYSAFGSYQGNGSSNGVFQWCGFRPRWILLKSTGPNGASWTMFDTARSAYNQTDAYLFANASGPEGNAFPIDILSNGFKLRTSDGLLNSSSYTYVWAAFAEHPFQYSRAR